MNSKTFKATLLAAAASFALVACGGGDDHPGYDANTATTPPETASASSQGFLDFVGTLANAMVDGHEPFDLITAVLCLAASLAAPARAAPLQPRSDDEVVEVLPTLGAFAAEQKRLRRALAQQPRHADTALALSRSMLERARHDGDARLAGQALGALAAWEGDANAPVEIRLQRATLRQYLHEFDAAVAELQALLRIAPRHPQTLLTLATVYRVQGRYAESDAGQALYARACSAENQALRGDFDASRRELLALLEAQPGNAFWATWIRTTLGEMEARADRPAAAVAQLEAALAATPDDAYARFTLADVLIDAKRWDDARALLGNAPIDTESEALLLRRAIVAQATGSDEAPAMRRTVAARYAQPALRPEAVPVHARERSRFALEVEGDAARALSLARSNLQTQREPVDFVVMDRAARAEVAALAAKIGLRDLRLGAPDGARS